MHLSTRAIKTLTSAMLVACAITLVIWPMLLGPKPPPHSSLAVNKLYAVRFVEYVGLIVLFLVFAGIGAIWVMRRTATEFREQQLKNLLELVDGSSEVLKKNS